MGWYELSWNLVRLLLGRFERYLDFVLSMQHLYELPESSTKEQNDLLLRVRETYFTCPPAERLAIASQVGTRAKRWPLVSHNPYPCT